VDEIEIKFAVQRRVDFICGADQEKRMAVRWRTDDYLGAKIPANAWPVLDDEWLSEPLRQPLPNEPRHYVGTPASVRACANACQSLSMTAISRRTLPLRLNSCDLVRSLEPPKLFCRMKE
jgi:hypothetical protein